MEERRGEERGRRELRIRGKRGKNWHSANPGYSGDLLLHNQLPQNEVAQNNYFLFSLMLLWVDGAQLGSSLVISQVPGGSYSSSCLMARLGWMADMAP